ncbi:hypothetical protein BH24DEI1_BH24DEI1_15440 [soil metagenome]
MRQVIIQVPRGQGERVMEIAEGQGGSNLALMEGRRGEHALDVVFVYLSNGRVEPLLEALDEVDDPHVVLIPQGVLALRPPADEAPQQVTDVEARSPLEVFLSGLQSIGSWRGFLGYAAAAGVVVWIGLFTNTGYLLVAAMLLAPFAGPATNVALGSARGDTTLLGRGVLRYLSALAVTILVAFLLSLLLGQEMATEGMIERSQISAVAVLLPLVAGAAGALNLVQSERSSLVSGAATGMLVAASLAPPAGLIGMASVIGDWGMVMSGLFLLVLQLMGINLSGAVVFRLYGLSARGAHYQRGRPWVFPASLFVTALALGGLLTWQFWQPPDFQRPTLAQRAAATVQEAVDESGMARLVEANLRFTRADIPGQNSLLAVIYVQRRAESELASDTIRQRLVYLVQQAILVEDLNVTPLVDVMVLEVPAEPGRSSPPVE